ncbi:hypothetical protein ABIC60_001744 [Phyllobacterium ifriqiyense]
MIDNYVWESTSRRFARTSFPLGILNETENKLIVCYCEAVMC